MGYMCTVKRTPAESGGMDLSRFWLSTKPYMVWDQRRRLLTDFSVLFGAAMTHPVWSRVGLSNSSPDSNVGDKFKV